VRVVWDRGGVQGDKHAPDEAAGREGAGTGSGRRGGRQCWGQVPWGATAQQRQRRCAPPGAVLRCVLPMRVAIMVQRARVPCTDREQPGDRAQLLLLRPPDLRDTHAPSCQESLSCRPPSCCLLCVCCCLEGTGGGGGQLRAYIAGRCAGQRSWVRRWPCGGCVGCVERGAGTLGRWRLRHGKEAA
jgi:hypothetical protein